MAKQTVKQITSSAQVISVHTVSFRLPLAERRNYTSVFNALRRIAAEEGFTALWTVRLFEIQGERARKRN